MPHHVGRIVDPDVREDGGLEPSVELDVPPESDAEAPATSQPLGATDAPPTAIEQSAATGTPGALEPLAATGTPPLLEPEVVRTAPLDLTVAAPGQQQTSSIASEPAAPSPSPSPSPEASFPFDAKPTSAERPRVADFEGLLDDDPLQRRSRDLELELVGEGLLSRPRGHSLPLPPAPRPPMSPKMIALFGAFLGVLTVATIIAIAIRIDHEKPIVPPVASTKPSAATVPEAPPEQAPEPKRRQREKVPGPYRVKDSANDPALRVVEGQIGFEPFLKAVEKAGVPLKEAYRLLVAFEKVRPLNQTSKHDKFVAAIDRASRRLKAFEYITGPEEVFQAKEGANGLLVAEKLDLQVKHERVTGTFAVASNGLEKAVTDAALEPQLLRAMREALIGHLSLEEIERGSRVRVIAQEVTALGEFARYAGIEALEIQFPDEKKRLRVYYFKGPKSRGYFDETARAPYEGGWRNPIPNAPITSRFNMHRMHPVLHRVMPHTGVDFGAATGVPIGACSFGTITFLGWGGPTGNFIRIDHGSGVETGYAHMSRFAEGLKVGDKVKRLQTIGYVGSTGRSTGPHLHFTVKRDGKFIDPLTLNLDALRVLPAGEREVFLQQKAQYDAQLDAIALPPAPQGIAPAAPSAATSERYEEDSEEAAGAGSAAPRSSAAAPPAEGSPTPPPKSGSALYLTDEELLRMQKSSESGEVEE